MNALDKIRRQGFTVRAANDDVNVEPESALSESQRRWLTDNKRQILDDLNAERWSQLIVLAQEHDVTADEVAARFTDQADIDDLLTLADEQLPACAKTITDAIHRSRTSQEAIKRDIESSKLPDLVKAIHKRLKPQKGKTCGTCDHFRRDERHANLGTCAMGEPEAPCGHWDTDNRDYCDSWQSLTGREADARDELLDRLQLTET